MIFFPGGKVEYNAYESLMAACAKRGIMSFLIKMPLDLLPTNAPNRIIKQYPGIKNWYIGGHSLGGLLASLQVPKNSKYYKGIILLASYTPLNLSKIDIKALSVFGSEDGVINSNNYNKYKKNLPKTLTEYIIPGGCHSYFGMYGLQKKDGSPKITNIEQIEITADKIAEFVKEN